MPLAKCPTHRETEYYSCCRQEEVARSPHALVLSSNPIGWVEGKGSRLARCRRRHGRLILFDDAKAKVVSRLQRRGSKGTSDVLGRERVIAWNAGVQLRLRHRVGHLCGVCWRRPLCEYLLDKSCGYIVVSRTLREGSTTTLVEVYRLLVGGVTELMLTLDFLMLLLRTKMEDFQINQVGMVDRRGVFNRTKIGGRKRRRRNVSGIYLPSNIPRQYCT